METRTATREEIEKQIWRDNGKGQLIHHWEIERPVHGFRTVYQKSSRRKIRFDDHGRPFVKLYDRTFPVAAKAYVTDSGWTMKVSFEAIYK